MNDILPIFPAHWRVTAPELLTETFSSRIWKVQLDNGTPAIVKDLKPFDDVYDELRGAYFLKWRDGVGAVRLLGFEGQQMLLEYGGEKHLVDVLNKDGDRTATEIAAETMQRLFSPSDIPFPAELQPLRERFVSLFRKANADRDAGRQSIYVEAAETAERLLSNPRELRPLHGDLHHENFILGPRGWLVIDAKGVLGDPAFDMANMFYNPLDRFDLTRDAERIASMAEIFARTLKRDVRDILDYAVAYGCLSSSWHHEDGNAEEEANELAGAAAIRDVALRL